MRKAIKEYLEYSNEEKDELWNTATFVFDTNVFLNLYRYSNKTRTQLLESFENLKNRIWMPYQVALEFSKDRYEVISEANSRFDNIQLEANKLIENWKKELRLDSKDSDIERLSKFMNDWISKKKAKNYKIFDVSDDDVLNSLLELFDGRTGIAFSDEEKHNIENEGEHRYFEKLPPGYKDNKKSDNRFGDLLVWKEILNYSKSNKKDIIFVTHDQKEDWWNINRGKTIGPRIELRREFYNETGHKFHMYNIFSYLSFYKKSKGKSIDKSTIDELESFSYALNITIPQNKIDVFNDSLEKRQKEISWISSRIARLEQKNEKRMQSIASIEAKKKEGKMNDQLQIAYKGNVNKIFESRKKILKLQNELNYLLSLD